MTEALLILVKALVIPLGCFYIARWIMGIIAKLARLNK